MTIPISERIPRHRISTCVVVRNERGWVLLVHLNYGDRKWSLPSGMLDHNEGLEASALRETYEETGLRVELDRLVGLYQNLAKRQLVVAFSASVVGGRLKRRTNETTDAMFWDPENLPKVLRGTHRDVLKDALRKRRRTKLRVSA